MKKVLLDTNVIIHREARNIVRGDIGSLFWWLDKLGYQKCIHQLTASEVRQHDDPKVRKTMAVKLESYSVLQVLAPESDEIKAMLASDHSQNDYNDTLLLSEVFARKVHILITEDSNIHKKAERLHVQHAVFTISEFLSKSREENPELPDYKILSVWQTRFGKLDVNDPFFTSFIDDYGSEFMQWFANKSEEKVFVSNNVQNNSIAAFLYLKIEQADEKYPDIHPNLPAKKKLKIGSFKVTDTGYKLGERFLKIAFEYALMSKVQLLYVTMFDTTTEHRSLIRLLDAWGFRAHGTTEKISPATNKNEQVFVRNFRGEVTDDIKTTYPFISRKWRKFITSIYPEYHTELLPDSILKTENLAEFQTSAGHRNAIQKVYVSWSKFKDLQPTDLIVFYRTGGYYKGVVTTVGVVTSIVTQIPDANTFIDLCQKRSVFSRDELMQLWDKYSWERPFIVNFLYVYSLPKRLNLKKLIELGVIADTSNAPRGFKQLSDEQFNSILEHSNANKDFIVD